MAQYLPSLYRFRNQWAGSRKITCIARLAAETLQAAMDDFMRKSKKEKADPQTT